MPTAGGPARSWPISPLQVEQQDDISSDVGDVDLGGYRNVHKTRKTRERLLREHHYIPHSSEHMFDNPGERRSSPVQLMW